MWKTIAKAKHCGVLIEFNGEKFCQIDWARKIGITHTALAWRLSRGWPLERALTERKGNTGPCSDPNSSSQRLLNLKNAIPMELCVNSMQSLGLTTP